MSKHAKGTYQPWHWVIHTHCCLGTHSWIPMIDIWLQFLQHGLRRNWCCHASESSFCFLTHKTLVLGCLQQKLKQLERHWAFIRSQQLLWRLKSMNPRKGSKRTEDKIPHSMDMRLLEKASRLKTLPLEHNKCKLNVKLSSTTTWLLLWHDGEL